MAKKHGPPGGPNTGDSFIKLAKARGADVQKAGRFQKISTPKGSVHITPGKDTLDSQTRSNIRKWFRLLGLMAFIFYLVDLMWPTIRNILHVIKYA